MWRVIAVRSGRDGGISSMGDVSGTTFTSNLGHSRLAGDTSIARAEAHGRFAARSPLRSVNEDLPVNRSPADLLRGEFLDNDHRAPAVRAAPVRARLGVSDSGHGRVRTARPDR